MDAAARHPSPGRSTATRLAAAFVAILGLFAAALLVVVPAMSDLERADREVAANDRAKVAGHRVAALVREQYIHQAHTVIEGNRSHLDHYKDIARTTRDASNDLLKFAAVPSEAALAREIAGLVERNDADFLTTTLPAIERGDHAEVLRLHGDVEKVVRQVAHLVEDLNQRWEIRSETARIGADAARRRVRLTLVVCFGAATLFAVVVAMATTRSISRRVGLILAGVRRVGDGDLTHRIRLTGGDELAALSRGLDDMTQRLEEHQEELVRSQKLASIGRLCSGVAHEINGPLGVILGYAKVIRREGADEEALRAIEHEAHECQRIVQALLDTSRHETPRFEPVDLQVLASDAVDRLRAMGKVGFRHIEVRAARKPVFALGDEEKLRQVVLNLLTNAAEATPERGAIVLQAAERNDFASLSIVDDGEGLSNAAKKRLFEPFFTTKEQGTGLGLAISRAIVEAHRGELVLDVAEGGGTRAELRLRPAREARQDFV